MTYGKVPKEVFLLLEGKDLASCMGVCKQWRDIARDEYFWKRLCAKRWPSICKTPTPHTLTYYKLFQAFYKRQDHRTLLPPRLSFDDLEFYVDMWTEERLIFSEVVPGSILRTGIKTPPPGICSMLMIHLEGPEYKMTVPVEPRALAFDYLDFSPSYPFISGIRAWVSLLFMEDGNEEAIDVFGIELDFCDTANSEEEVLWLLDMLDWT
ncbi:hypothetical protein HHK36_007337 [Tetracentron sinense]|uniref:F-box domain-containing protein n=1 Tax=Tetracentron sinense TaxID=13715 RepID=A0A834ZMB2_TETSI|nr:hypothetical protein HHK36_007337 [Tetracentron sinense]